MTFNRPVGGIFLREIADEMLKKPFSQTVKHFSFHELFLLLLFLCLDGYITVTYNALMLVPFSTTVFLSAFTTFL